MQNRPLGSSGLSVPPLAFGGNVFGWTVDERTAFELLDAFVAAGFTMIDTADVYPRWAPGNVGGESETIVGRWVQSRGNRDEVLLATKVGMETSAGTKGLSRQHILESANASLHRLQTDRIDLYYAHVDDPSTPIEETLRAFGDLQDAGKVRSLGASNFTGPRLREALDVGRRQGLPLYTCLQPRYNLMDRTEFESTLAPVCQELGLGVLTYSSLASGFLTGKYRSRADLGKSPRGGRAEARLNERGHRVLGALDAAARRTGTSPTSVAIAWLLSRRTVSVPIASATSIAQLEELLSGVSVTLDPESIADLDRASE